MWGRNYRNLNLNPNLFLHDKKEVLLSQCPGLHKSRRGSPWWSSYTKDILHEMARLAAILVLPGDDLVYVRIFSCLWATLITSYFCILPFSGFEDNMYRQCGTLIAMSLIHGGPSPYCFSESTVDHILNGSVKPNVSDIADPTIRDHVRKVCIILMKYTTNYMEPIFSIQVSCEVYKMWSSI